MGTTKQTCSLFIPSWEGTSQVWSRAWHLLAQQRQVIHPHFKEP